MHFSGTEHFRRERPLFKKEFKQFLYISRESLCETVTMLQIFIRKKWLDQKLYEKLYLEAEEINKMISGSINAIKI